MNDPIILSQTIAYYPADRTLVGVSLIRKLSLFESRVLELFLHDNMPITRQQISPILWPDGHMPNDVSGRISATIWHLNMKLQDVGMPYPTIKPLPPVFAYEIKIGDKSYA